MASRAVLERLLQGEDFRLYYGELEQILHCARYDFLEASGFGRTWKHAAHRDLLTVRDGGEKPMYYRYVRKAGKHLRKVQLLGGYDAATDFE